MKKTAKAILSAALTLLLMTALLTATLAEAADPSRYLETTGSKVTLKTAQDLIEYAYLGRNGGKKGPITITKGTLKEGKESCTVYLVGLSDTELVDEHYLPVLGQTTGFDTDFIVGMEQKNDYERNAEAAIKKTVPKGSNLIFTGHSLGGMVGQQLAADPQIQKKYNVLYTICFGTPAVFPGEQEGKVVRFGDTHDIVPYLSIETLKDYEFQDSTLIKEDGGYRYDILFSAHRKSYREAPEWTKYDVLGQEGGSAKLGLNYKSIRYFKSCYRGITIKTVS